MELPDSAKLVKEALATLLEKEGRSIYDLEDALMGLGTGKGVVEFAKVASCITKEAFFTFDTAKLLGSVGDVAAAGVKLPVGLGASAGLIASEASDYNRALYNALDKERQKVEMLRNVTANLKREHGIH